MSCRRGSASCEATRDGNGCDRGRFGPKPAAAERDDLGAHLVGELGILGEHRHEIARILGKNDDPALCEFVPSDCTYSNLRLFSGPHRYAYHAGPWPCVSGCTYDGCEILIPLFDFASAPLQVLQALQDGLGVPREALRVSWESLARAGNLSSASVLMILERTLLDHAGAPGEHGVMLAMGPGFCSELLLLRW